MSKRPWKLTTRKNRFHNEVQRLLEEVVEKASTCKGKHRVREAMVADRPHLEVYYGHLHEAFRDGLGITESRALHRWMGRWAEEDPGPDGAYRRGEFPGSWGVLGRGNVILGPGPGGGGQMVVLNLVWLNPLEFMLGKEKLDQLREQFPPRDAPKPPTVEEISRIAEDLAGARPIMRGEEE